MNPKEFGELFGLIVWKCENKIPLLNNIITALIVVVELYFLVKFEIINLLITFISFLVFEGVVYVYVKYLSLHAHVKRKREWREKWGLN